MFTFVFPSRLSLWAWCSYSTGSSRGKCPAGCSGQISATAALVRQTEWAGRTADAHVTTMMMMMKSSNWSRGRGEMCSDKQPKHLNHNDLITTVTWPLHGEQTYWTQVCVCEDVSHLSFCISMRDQYRQEERGAHTHRLRQQFSAYCTVHTGEDSINLCRAPDCN